LFARSFGATFAKSLWPLVDIVNALVSVTGWLYDISLSYDNSFYMMGVCIVVSGAMLYPIPCIQRWRHDHKKAGVSQDPETNAEEQHALKPVTT